MFACEQQVKHKTAEYINMESILIHFKVFNNSIFIIKIVHAYFPHAVLFHASFCSVYVIQKYIFL